MANTTNQPGDGIDRRGFLKCMQWAGTGLVWSVAGGIPASALLASNRAPQAADFSFVQISDSHIGFNRPANPDVTATLQTAVDKINALPKQPDLIIHTGDISHLSTAKQFDDTVQVLQGFKQPEIFYVPGEHDFMDDGKRYLERFGKQTTGRGWYSFDHKGVHFVGLNNCVQLEGLGQIGGEQLDWLKNDLTRISSSTPVVVFAHIPLWAVYPKWGWGTGDAEHALSMLRRFGSVTVLNGHIHQVMQKVEGRVAFHTAMSTAFPQPAPGSAPAASPMKVPAERLRQVLGIADVTFVRGQDQLAVVDESLAAGVKS